MPLINIASLTSFLGENSFVTKGAEDDSGHASAVAQAENIVYQKTLIPIPDEIEDAIPTLQFCAHAIYIYMVSFKQKLDKDEIGRREKLFDRAINMLDTYTPGKNSLLDNNGDPATTDTPESSTYDVDNTDRSERW